MANTRTSGDGKKKTTKKRGKCPAGCKCGRHKNTGNTAGAKPPIRKSTIKKQNDFIQALQSTAGVISPALDMVGISRSTYRRWYNDDDDFRERMDDVEFQQKDFARTQLMKGIKTGSERLIEFYLDRRDPEFAKKTFHDITTGGEKVAPSIMFVPASTINKNDDSND